VPKLSVIPPCTPVLCTEGIFAPPGVSSCPCRSLQAPHAKLQLPLRSPLLRVSGENVILCRGEAMLRGPHLALFPAGIHLADAVCQPTDRYFPRSKTSPW